MLLKFQVDPASVSSTVDHVEQTKMRVIAAIVAGMWDAMRGLAEHTAEETPSQKGWLKNRIAASPRVTETPDLVLGTVGATGFGRSILRWIEGGVNQPAVNVAAARKRYGRIQERIAAYRRGEGARPSWGDRQYLQRESTMVYDPHHTGQAQGFFTSHQAFSIAGRPYMQRSLNEQREQIFQAIERRIMEARRA